MLHEHLGYISDRVRTERFAAAISRVVNPGDVVADLGCGSGILGLLCLKAGADRLIALDDTAMIEVAREALSRAGWERRALFIRGISQRVELPESVDLVICDHVGYFGFDYDIVRTLQDARSRFLKSGGHIVPSRLRLQIGAVESQEARATAERGSGSGVMPEFHWLRLLALNTKHSVDLADDALLGTADLGSIDFRADQPEFFSWTAELRVERGGVVHGLAGWFDCELAEGVWMTNSPLAEEPIDRPQAFLPIDEPVQVRSGDVIKATIMARPAEHLIAWVAEFPASGQRFSHSTWQGMLLAPEDLSRAHPDRIPHLSPEGEARVTVLQYCDGVRTALDIERAVLNDHPALFPSRQEISRFVAQVLGRDTE